MPSDALTNNAGPAQRPGRHLWTFAVGLLLLLVAVAAGVYLVVRPEATRDAGQVVGYTPPPIATVTKSAAAVGLQVALLRGGRTGCVTTGGCNDDNYDAWLKYMKGWAITTNASGGTGYVAGNVQNPKVDYLSRLQSVVRDNPKLVLVEGSVSDMRYSYGQVRAAATEVYTTLRRELPGAKVVVIGPMWGGPTPPNSLKSVEQALKAASSGLVTKFIDPIAEGWFTGVNSRLMNADHVTPTNEGHRLIAQRISSDLAGVDLSVAK